MSSLHDLQRQFADTLRGEHAASAAFVVANGIPASERLAIYRNNIRANFHTALLLTYPAIHRLVGATFFQQLSEQYRTACPSTSGDLQYVGDQFAAFLQQQFAVSDYAYLPDVAAFEWAFQLAAIAPHCDSRIVERLARVAAADYDALTLTLHASAQLVSSPFPVLDIWRANRNEEAVDTELTIDLRSGASHVLLLRREREVEVLRLGRADFQFLTELQRQATLPDAIAAATALELTFDAAAALPRFVQLGVIVDCNVLENTS